MPQISASVDAKTVVAISDMAKRENRSFSEMVNMLLAQALSSKVIVSNIKQNKK